MKSNELRTECLEGDTFLGQLPLGEFVTVDAELGVVGKVGAELQEERERSLRRRSKSRTG